MYDGSSPGPPVFVDGVARAHTRSRAPAADTFQSVKMVNLNAALTYVFSLMMFMAGANKVRIERGPPSRATDRIS